MTPVTKELKSVNNLLAFVVEYCLDVQRQTEDCMAPFSLFMDGAGAQSLHILDNNGVNTKDELFDIAIRKSKPTIAIFAMESSVSMGSNIVPAILLKVYEKGKPEMTILTQAYRPATTRQTFSKINNIQLMGFVPNHHYVRKMFNITSVLSFFL